MERNDLKLEIYHLEVQGKKDLVEKLSCLEAERGPVILHFAFRLLAKRASSTCQHKAEELGGLESTRLGSYQDDSQDTVTVDSPADLIDRPPSIEFNTLSDTQASRTEEKDGARMCHQHENETKEKFRSISPRKNLAGHRERTLEGASESQLNLGQKLLNILRKCGRHNDLLVIVQNRKGRFRRTQAREAITAAAGLVSACKRPSPLNTYSCDISEDAQSEEENIIAATKTPPAGEKNEVWPDVRHRQFALGLRRAPTDGSYAEDRRKSGRRPNTSDRDELPSSGNRFRRYQPQCPSQSSSPTRTQTQDSGTPRRGKPRCTSPAEGVTSDQNGVLPQDSRPASSPTRRARYRPSTAPTESPSQQWVPQCCQLCQSHVSPALDGAYRAARALDIPLLSEGHIEKICQVSSLPSDLTLVLEGVALLLGYQPAVNAIGPTAKSKGPRHGPQSLRVSKGVQLFDRATLREMLCCSCFKPRLERIQIDSLIYRTQVRPASTRLTIAKRKLQITVQLQRFACNAKIQQTAEEAVFKSVSQTNSSSFGNGHRGLSRSASCYIVEEFVRWMAAVLDEYDDLAASGKLRVLEHEDFIPSNAIPLKPWSPGPTKGAKGSRTMEQNRKIFGRTAAGIDKDQNCTYPFLSGSSTEPTFPSKGGICPAFSGTRSPARLPNPNRSSTGSRECSDEPDLQRRTSRKQWIEDAGEDGLVITGLNLA